MIRLIFLRRFFVVFFSLIFAAFVIFLSLWRLNLSMLGPDDKDVLLETPAQERISQLFRPPILPDHPFYMLGMISDRLDLWLANPSERVALKFQYADTRLATAEVLISRRRLGMALTTLTKAEKYIISAAEDIPILPEELQESARVSLVRTILTHERLITAMKPSFTGPQQATIDRLLEQILILIPNR